MRPRLWQPPVALSPAEAALVKRIQRAKRFVFLRQPRHVLFSAAFQEALGTLRYADAAVGPPPIPPAQRALATLLQAYTGVSDNEVIAAVALDRRWQVVLDCLDAPRPPCSKATVVAFRQRLIATEGDRRLVARTLEVASEHGGFGPRARRAALASSPWWGAGRVEDTYNVLGHALRKAVSMLARQQGWGLAALAERRGVPVVGAPGRLQAALDLDWDDPAARGLAVPTVLAALEHLAMLLATATPVPPLVQASLATAQAVRAQDVVRDAAGAPRLRRGVAPERRSSVADAQLRHGRKSRRHRFDGDQRPVRHDLDSGLGRGGSDGGQCPGGHGHRGAPGGPGRAG
jgi:transposase